MINYRKLPRPNLWLHTFLVILSVYLFIGLDGYKYLLVPGYILIFGMGDGYPSTEQKILGGILLALLAILILLIFTVVFLFFARLLFDKTRSWLFRICLMSGMLILFFGIFFKKWESNADGRAKDAIFVGDINAYERAIKWRKAGNIDDDLWCAARDGQLYMVQYLISKGANPNAKLGGSGDSVLSGAIPNVMNKPDGNKPVIEYLTSHGATN